MYVPTCTYYLLTETSKTRREEIGAEIGRNTGERIVQQKQERGGQIKKKRQRMFYKGKLIAAKTGGNGRPKRDKKFLRRLPKTVPIAAKRIK